MGVGKAVTSVRKIDVEEEAKEGAPQSVCLTRWAVVQWLWPSRIPRQPRPTFLCLSTTSAPRLIACLPFRASRALALTSRLASWEAQVATDSRCMHGSTLATMYDGRKEPEGLDTAGVWTILGASPLGPRSPCAPSQVLGGGLTVPDRPDR